MKVQSNPSEPIGLSSRPLLQILRSLTRFYILFILQGTEQSIDERRGNPVPVVFVFVMVQDMCLFEPYSEPCFRFEGAMGDIVLPLVDKEHEQNAGCKCKGG